MKRIIALIVSAGVLLMQPLELTVFARTEAAEPSVSVPWAEVKPAQPGNDTGTGETANETQEETESQAEASPVPGVTEGRLPAKGGEAQLPVSGGEPLTGGKRQRRVRIEAVAKF